MEQLREAFERNGLTRDELLGDKYFRIKRLRALQAAGSLDDSLRWISAPDLELAEVGT
jgi:hypothetical protein